MHVQFIVVVNLGFFQLPNGDLEKFKNEFGFGNAGTCKFFVRAHWV